MKSACLTKLVVTLTLVLPFAPFRVQSQDDRGERIQESISSSDQKIDFAAAKAAPPSIQSAAYQNYAKQKQQYKIALREYVDLKRKLTKRAANLRREMSQEDRNSLAQAEVRARRAREAMLEAEKKANSD